VTPVKSSAAPLLNLLTIVVLLATLAAGGFLLWIYLNPTSALNPLPPPTPVGLAPVDPATPLPSETPSPQPSPTLTATITTTPTPRPEVKAATPADTPTPEGSPTPAGWSYAFDLQ